MCVCVRARVRARVRACVRACVRARARARVLVSSTLVPYHRQRQDDE